MKIVLTGNLTDLVTNFALSCKPKTRTRFLTSWGSGNEKYFCFLFIESRALLKVMPKSIDFHKGIFLHVIPVRIIVPCSVKTYSKKFPFTVKSNR